MELCKKLIVCCCKPVNILSTLLIGNSYAGVNRIERHVGYSYIRKALGYFFHRGELGLKVGMGNKYGPVNLCLQPRLFFMKIIPEFFKFFVVTRFLLFKPEIPEKPGQAENRSAPTKRPSNNAFNYR